jgi:integrase
MKVSSESDAVEVLLKQQGDLPDSPARSATVETDAGWAFFNVNGYLGTVTVEGRFEITYTEEGKQVWQTISGGLREARAARANVVVKHERGERAAPSRQTVAEAAAEYLAAQATRLRPKTLETYGTHLRLHVLPSKLGKLHGPTLGSRRVNSVKPHDVALLVAELRTKGLDEWTAHGVLTPMSALFQYAIQNEWCDRNPVRALDKSQRPSTASRKRKRILSSEEVGRLLTATPKRYRLAVATQLYTGTRVGELCGLVWGNIDFEAGIVRIEKQLDRKGGRVEPKTPQAVREIVLMPQLVPLLKDHRKAALAKGRARPSDPVFASETGTAAAIRNYTRRGLEAGLVAAGLLPPLEERKKAKAGGVEPDKPPITSHTLRRTFVSHLILDLKLDAVQVSKQVGHAKPSITQNEYADLFDRARHHDEIREAMRASAFGAALATSSAKRTAGETRRTGDAATVSNVAVLRESGTGGDR